VDDLPSGALILHSLQLDADWTERRGGGGEAVSIRPESQGLHGCPVVTHLQKAALAAPLAARPRLLHQADEVDPAQAGVGSQRLQPLGRLAQVEALDLAVDAVQLVRRGAVSAPGRGRERAEAPQVHLQAAAVEVGPGAAGAAVRPLPRVQPLVELEVDELGEARRARLAQVGPLARVQPLVGLQVAGAAETLVAHLWDQGSDDGQDDGDVRAMVLTPTFTFR